jgi:uncharacterized membrane protein YkoI
MPEYSDWMPVVRTFITERKCKMTYRRLVAFAVMAILLAGTLGLSSRRASAQGPTPTPVPQIQAQPTTEIQPGNQVEDGQPDSTSEIAGSESPEGAAEAEAAGEAAVGVDNGPDQQQPAYAGSVTVSPDQFSGASEADEAAALAGRAVITSSQAESAALGANPGASVVKTELDNENGVVVYSVELSNGADVKVDAGNGSILHTDQGGNNEG